MYDDVDIFRVKPFSAFLVFSNINPNLMHIFDIRTHSRVSLGFCVKNPQNNRSECAGLSKPLNKKCEIQTTYLPASTTYVDSYVSIFSVSVKMQSCRKRELDFASETQ